jgi:hypothetical protein
LFIAALLSASEQRRHLMNELAAMDFVKFTSVQACKKNLDTKVEAALFQFQGAMLTALLLFPEPVTLKNPQQEACLGELWKNIYPNEPLTPGSDQFLRLGFQQKGSAQLIARSDERLSGGR